MMFNYGIRYEYTPFHPPAPFTNQFLEVLVSCLLLVFFEFALFPLPMLKVFRGFSPATTLKIQSRLGDRDRNGFQYV